MDVVTEVSFANTEEAANALKEYGPAGLRNIELFSKSMRRDTDLYALFDAVQSLVRASPKHWNRPEELLPVREHLLYMASVICFDRSITFSKDADKHIEYGQLAQRLFETIGVVQAGIQNPREDNLCDVSLPDIDRAPL